MAENLQPPTFQGGQATSFSDTVEISSNDRNVDDGIRGNSEYLNQSYYCINCLEQCRELPELLSRLEQSEGPKGQFCPLCCKKLIFQFSESEQFSTWDILPQAIEADEPEIFRYFVRFHTSAADWEYNASWIFTSLASAPPAIMVKFHRILCEEGVCLVEMLEFAIEHQLGEITSLIRRHYPEAAAQHKLFEAMSLGCEKATRELLSSPVLCDKAVAKAVKTRKRSIVTIIDRYLAQVGHGGICWYLSDRAFLRRTMTDDDLDFVHQIFCTDGTCRLSIYECCIYHPSYIFSFLPSYPHFPPPAISPSLRLWRRSAPNTSSRRTMALGVGLMLRTLCSDLKSFLDSSLALTESAIPENIYRYRVVWRDGTRAIRRLMDGKPPATSYEMLTLLMSAYSAARSGPNCPEFDKVQFVDDLARWRHFLSPGEQKIFDVAAAALWNFVTGTHGNSKEVMPSELLHDFQDFVGRVMAIAPSEMPSPKAADETLEELRTAFDQSMSTSVSESPEGGPRSFAGGGKSAPLELLDPPDDTDTDWSFKTLGQGLDVLASLDIGEDPGLNKEPSGNIPHDQNHDCPLDEDLHSAEDSVSDVVIILLASVAVSLFILALLALRYGINSQSFNAISLAHSVQATPLCKAFCMFEVFFLYAAAGTTRSPPTPQPRVSPPTAETTSFHHTSIPNQDPSSQQQIAPEASTFEQFSLPDDAVPIPPASRHDSPSAATLPSFSPSVDPRLTCQHCSKNFRTLSAKNQHGKTGCKLRHDRLRFKCGVEGCTRLFSTNGNRKDHEAKRCPFRVVGI
ncbi:hypothetical protein B0T14DRAFT_604902 [Immersiella caudata]|uniref:Uncharacterized protein n=1 Tax=Immersiella caudata TaxID=314043 RepID=A0AA39WJP9_9PEZI|nr:hypothetical protein B0T14DRAFT_604902 [Immersiella caudata]